MTRRLYIFLIAIYFLKIPVLGQSTAISESQIALLDTFLIQKSRNKLFNGGILIAQNGNIIFEKFYGFANPTTLAPFDTNSVFMIASLSKQFTASGIMLLKQKKQLNYDELVIKYIPKFPYNNITIRHLLTHTSGLPKFDDIKMKYLDTTIVNGNKELMSILIDHSPITIASPGVLWDYSDIGYDILAMIIEKVSKEKYNEFIKNNLFKPAGMHNSSSNTTNQAKANIPNLVYGYKYFPDSLKYVPAHTLKEYKFIDYLGKFEGDGSIYSTLRDLYKWDLTLNNYVLIKQNELDTAFTPYQSSDGKVKQAGFPTTTYGFGWFINNINNPETRYVSHGGTHPGYSGFYAKYKDITIITLANADMADKIGFRKRLTRIFINNN